MQSAAGQTETYSYDNLRRLSTVSNVVYTKRYGYRDLDSTRTTGQVETLTYDLPTDLTFSYTYDNMGNIVTYTDANGTVTYTYDDLGQLTKAEGTETYEYSYDNAGNILSANGHTYTYGDSTWADLLTKVDGQSITYDAIGNPTSYYNGTSWSFTWARGRELAAASGNGKTVTYSYNADGLRTGKVVNGDVYEYYYAGDKLMRMTMDQNGTHRCLDFYYDASGPYAVKVTNATATTTYYYVKNLQGDIVAIVNRSGKVLVTYTYDPWGNVLSIGGEYKNGLGVRNPLRYRGYVYDNETKFYYLQSRYYDPEIGRFINADSYTSTGQGVLGNNMFAYCLNNPIVGCDPTGNFGIWAIIAAGTIVGGLLGVFSAATTGGNILEGFIEGCITGAIGSACGLWDTTLFTAVTAAGLGGAATDFLIQVAAQYIENKSINLSEISIGRIIGAGITTAAGVFVPKYGTGTGNGVDIFGTALIWGEASVVITCISVAVTQLCAAENSSSNGAPLSQCNYFNTKHIMMQK